MMVSVDKIEQGLANFLDSEFMPQFHGNAVEKVIVGTTASLLIRRTGTIIDNMKDNGVVKMLGIIDDKGAVDVDTLTEEVKKNFPKEGIKVEVPVIGALTFHKEDVDKLYDYIMV